MRITSKHLQYSIIAGLITVSGLTIGFAGAEDFTLPTFALSFIQTSPNTVTDGPFAGAKFDIGGYLNNPCYQIAGTEAQTCEDQFGLTESLKTYIDNGSLLAYLQANGLATGNYATISSSESSASSVSNAASSVSSESTTATSESSSVTSTPEPAATSVLNDSIKTEADFDLLRQNRSNAVWFYCSEHNDTRYEITACFQRNMKLIMRLNSAIEGNIQ